MADGQDVALVRAELLDHSGRLVSPRDPSTNTTVTFRVASGAGRILGTISGSPFDTPLADPGLDMTGAVSPAHYGILRTFVQSTRVCVGSAADRALLAAIHTDAGRDGAAKIVGGAGCGEGHGADDVVVTATADGQYLLHLPTVASLSSVLVHVAKLTVGICLLLFLAGLPTCIILTKRRKKSAI